MSRDYFRPIVQSDAVRPAGAMPLAGRLMWFDRVEVLRRAGSAQVIAAAEVPKAELGRLSAPRKPVCGYDWSRPVLMGVLNVTPDSFSDGGKHSSVAGAVAHGLAMERQGADIIDIGGESTRPGAEAVDGAVEAGRVVPVIEGLKAAGLRVPVSIDTRKASVARAAIAAGAVLFNDVTAFRHDPASMALAAETGVAVCLMHSLGEPETMQENPVYADVLLDIYDHLELRIEACAAAGIARDRIVVDPGIGFGKTLDHNLVLLRGLSLLHGLGCPVLLGVSRKRFIGTLGGEADPAKRMPGSIAAGLEGLRQGVQILRVHDMAETAQAVAVWRRLLPGQETQ